MRSRIKAAELSLALGPASDEAVQRQVLRSNMLWCKM